MDTEKLNSKFQKFKKNFVINDKTNSSISETELIEKLQDFKNKCRKKGYIQGDLYIDEAYPGMIPTSFIVNLLPKKQWLDNINRGKALDLLIEALCDTTEPKIRENIFTLRMLSIEDLSSEQMIRLYYDNYETYNPDRPMLIDFIKTGTLTEHQIRRIFATVNSEIIGLLVQNKNAQEVAYRFSDLKVKWLQSTM